MKITALRTQPLVLPFTCEFGTPFANSPRLGALAIFLDTKEGIVGEGLLISVQTQWLPVLAEMVRALETLVVGQQASFSARFLHETFEASSHLGAAGVARIAIGGFEAAMFDLRGKAAGLPVHRLLGARRARVAAYYSSGFWNQVSLENLQETARKVVAHGYRAMKVRLNTGPIGEQVRRLKGVRAAVGDDVGLMVDAGRRFDVTHAIRLGRELEQFGLNWFEEPVAADDHDGEGRVAAALVTPIACGESVFSFAEFQQMVRGRAVDVLMPDLQRIGGPSEFLKVGHMAEAAGVPVSSHLAPQMSLPLLAAMPNATFLEVMPWASPLYAEPIEIENGMAIVPERPGWGFSLDSNALRRYAA
jgi:L-alanine-DL-glutamate epimerase-like enolase superfamily enzyme